MDDRDQSPEGAPKRPPGMAKWEAAVDEAIREAQARGDFENLPGQGKPLRWETAGDDSEWWLANHMLKGAGLLPAWIEDDRAIRAEKHALATMLEDFAGSYRAASAQGRDAADPAGHAGREAELEGALARLVSRYRERAAALNARIDRHNLAVPAPSLQHVRVRVEDELARLRAALGD